MFVENHNKASNNSPYKFNGKELDAETGYYYYGARYYNPRVSLWLNVDPLADYNPHMNDEHYIDGQHNGGVYNSGNLNPYIYCYQSPVRYIDPNGKQAESSATKRHDDNDMSQVVTIRGGRYYKNTTNNPAKVANIVNSWFGGDSDYFVEKKAYSFEGNLMTHRIVNESAGALVGGVAGKFGGKLLSRTLFRESGQVVLKFCFVEGTLVSTEKGDLPIQKIKIGDNVWSYNSRTKKNELKKVYSIIEKDASQILEVLSGDIKIQCTFEHPFYINGEWIEAQNLTIGTNLTLYNGNTIKISALRKIFQNVKVYNFEVEDNHNYYISKSKVLVHNSCEWKTVLHPGSLEKTIEKTWGKKAVETFDNVIEQLASGKAGKNVHDLGGGLKGYKAIDLAGTGSGRGTGRIIFKETSEQVEIVGAVKGHDYTKIIK